MTIEVRRLKSVCLTEQIGDPADRSVMAMSTLLANEEWLLECSWDGERIGDVQVFRNASAANGRHPTPGSEWVWWGGVPCGKIKSYRFEDGEYISPMTVSAPHHAQPQKESGSAGKVAKA